MSPRDLAFKDLILPYRFHSPPRAIQHQLLAAHAATIADVIDHGILPGG